MRNYFSKTLLEFIIAILVYFAVNAIVFIRDHTVITALITFTVLFCVIIYSYINSNFNQFGNE